MFKKKKSSQQILAPGKHQVVGVERGKGICLQNLGRRTQGWFPRGGEVSAEFNNLSGR